MKMRHCFNCGKDRACEREARYARDAVRAEAHENIDRDMGY